MSTITAAIASVDDKKPALLVFSHLRWNFVFQRPQHLLTRAALTHNVVFFEEPRFEAGVKPHLVENVAAGSGVRVIVPQLPEGLSAEKVVAAQRELLDGLCRDLGAGPLITWYYTPQALSFSRHLQPDLCIYDCMDELSAFKGANPELHRLEAEMFRRAGLVFVGGRSLFESKRHFHQNIHLFASSIDVKHFGRARRWQGAEPADQAAKDRPRIGFFAVIDERLDVGLVEAVAKLKPDWQFVILGPVVKIDPASLPRRDNIHWLGSKPYDVLPAYLSGWDAGLMPFALNESTRFISPTKTPEFLAAGLPLVSTPVADVVDPYSKAGLVEIARTPEEVVERLEHVLTRPREPWLAKVDRHLSTMSWDRTWLEMAQLIKNALPQAAPLAPARRQPDRAVEPRYV